MSDETLEKLTGEVVRERTPIPGVPSGLMKLVEAASSGPWRATEGWIDDVNNADLLSSEGAFYSHKDAHLAALAPDMARAGQALVEAMGDDTVAEHLDTCLESAEGGCIETGYPEDFERCVVFYQLGAESHNRRNKALATWDALGKTEEERDE